MAPLYSKPTTQLQDQARQTIKETTENTKQINGVTQIYQKPTTHLQDEAKTTIKQTTENNKYLSGISPLYPKPQTELQDEAKTTIKQTTIDNKYLSGVNRENGDGYISNKYDAKTTIKQTTINNKYIGPLGKEISAPESQMAQKNMEIDERKQKLIYRNSPTNVGNFQGPEKGVMNLTKFNESVLYSHMNHPHTEQSGTMGFYQTKNRQDLLNINTERINPYVLSGITDNPLVNNVLIQRDYSQCDIK